MDGLLVIDKPSGPTSHDVVARVRRATGERRIGHTGTLDPAASGVLPLVLGCATRLARFLSAGDKSYEAVVRLGVATDTYDAEGVPVGPTRDGTGPSNADIERALDEWRGTFLQRPPIYSAKKVNGTESYKRARAQARTPAPLAPLEPLKSVRVTAHAIRVLDRDGDLLTLEVDCSAGFYVRSLAHDLGERLGTGAHLAALRRTRSAGLTLADAVPLDDLERALEDDPDAASCWLTPLSGMLTHLPAVVLTDEGLQRALHGRDLGPAEFGAGMPSPSPEPAPANPGQSSYVRLLDPAGRLIGIAVPTPSTSLSKGLLHPSVVLV